MSLRSLNPVILNMVSPRDPHLLRNETQCKDCSTEFHRNSVIHEHIEHVNITHRAAQGLLQGLQLTG